MANASSCSAIAGPDTSRASSTNSASRGAEALWGTPEQSEGSHGGTASHEVPRSRSLPSSPSLLPHPAPSPPFSTPSSPLQSISRSSFLPLDVEHGVPGSKLPAATLTTNPDSTAASSTLSPLLATCSPASSHPAQTASYLSELKLRQTTNKLMDDLVDPLLQSFASLHIQDGVTGAKAQMPSPPLCSSTERATLLTNGTNPYFVSTVARVKETQQEFSKKLIQMDQDIVEARAQAIQHLSAAVHVLVRARERINQQQLTIEAGCKGAKESVEDLEMKLRKAQRDITTLRAEHIATTGLLEQMSSDVSSLRDQDEDLGTRLARTKESVFRISAITDALTTLADELRTQNTIARRFTYAPRPSFALDTSIEEQLSSHDSASSSRSQSFAESRLEPPPVENCPGDSNIPPPGQSRKPVGSQSDGAQSDGTHSLVNGSSPGLSGRDTRNGGPIEEVVRSLEGREDGSEDTGPFGENPEPSSFEYEDVPSAFPPDWLFAIMTVCQDIAEPTFLETYAWYSATATYTAEWLAAMKARCPSGPDVFIRMCSVLSKVLRWFCFFVVVISVGFGVYLGLRSIEWRSTTIDSPMIDSPTIDSPIWESLAPNL